MMVIDGEESLLSRILKECRGARERAKFILNRYWTIVVFHNAQIFMRYELVNIHCLCVEIKFLNDKFPGISDHFLDP